MKTKFQMVSTTVLGTIASKPKFSTYFYDCILLMSKGIQIKIIVSYFYKEYLRQLSGKFPNAPTKVCQRNIFYTFSTFFFCS